jgi:hypothetical protein
MKAILINPFDKSITEVELKTGDLAEIYALTDSTIVEAVSVSQGNDVFINEEGLLGDLDEQQFFLLGDNNNGWMMLAGKGLVLGNNSDGDSVSTTLTVPQLWQMVAWPEHEHAVTYAHRLLEMSGTVVPLNEAGGIEA